MVKDCGTSDFSLSMIDFSPRNLSPIGRVVAWALLALIVSVFYFATPYMGAATIAYGCLILGLVERKKRNFHMSLMLTGISVDILIVLFLEATRAAIGTATGESLSVLQYTHIGVSLAAVILYLPIVIHGYFLSKRATHSEGMRHRHIVLGIVAFVLRSVGWVTMFSFINFSS